MRGVPELEIENAIGDMFVAKERGEASSFITSHPEVCQRWSAHCGRDQATHVWHMAQHPMGNGTPERGPMPAPEVPRKRANNAVPCVSHGSQDQWKASTAHIHNESRKVHNRTGETPRKP